MRGRARRDEPVEVREHGAPEAGLARPRLLLDDVDRLPRPVVARPRHRRRRLRPELVDGGLLPDDHPRLAAHDGAGERSAPGPGRDDVRTDVAERH